MAVARAGEADIPARAAPVALRPFLHFAKLPPRALVAARRALDADEEFRARVAEQVSTEEVGPAGWLLLTRPPGWEAELGALAQQADEEAARVADVRAEDDARRRVGAAEGAARRAEEAAAAARAELARATGALAEERRARRAATREASDAVRRAEALVAERERATAEAATARAEAASARAEAVSAQAGAATARAERDRAEAARVAAVAAEAAARAALGAVSAKAEAAAVGDVGEPRAGKPERARAAVAPDMPVPLPGTGAAPGDGAEALAAAADAARALADALAAAAQAIAGPADLRPAGAVPPPVTGSQLPRTQARPSPPRVKRPRRTRRTPAPLPPAIFEESLEAAEHLSRLPGVVVLVDGYNVSQEGWPGVSIAEQRRRLADALAELVARTSADIRVIFDGSETAEPQAVAATARPVRVRFSPPDVEADDVIVAEVGEIPASRPVVVASSDRRVRDESRALGANLLWSSQLLALLRR